MDMLAGRRRFSLTTLWQMARTVGELDLRATLGFKPFLTELASHFRLSPLERAAVSQVARWNGAAFYPSGAQRTSSGQPTGYVRSPGFAILSAWFSRLENLVAAPGLGPALGQTHPAAEVQSYTRTPQTTSPQFRRSSCRRRAERLRRTAPRRVALRPPAQPWVCDTCGAAAAGSPRRR